jgi:hypothetical protein
MYSFHRPNPGGNTWTNLRPIADGAMAASACSPAGILDPEQTGCGPELSREGRRTVAARFSIPPPLAQ